jgi:hypothetical protein
VFLFCRNVQNVEKGPVAKRAKPENASPAEALPSNHLLNWEHDRINEERDDLLALTTKMTRAVRLKPDLILTPVWLSKT